MAAARRWVAATAASVLGIGVIATSAIGVANAMPLVESTRVADVPPITTVPGDQKGAPAAVPGGGTTPAPSASVGPTSAPVASPSVAPAPAPAPQPVAPRPAVTDSAASAPSVASPASVDD